MNEKTKHTHLDVTARPWIECPFCDDMWCALHEQHAFACVCLPIDGHTNDE